MAGSGSASPGSSFSDLYVARQPIFTVARHVHAYELLFRSGSGNYFDAVNPDLATSRVMSSTLSGIGLEHLTDGRPAFINFTRELLVNGAATLMSPKGLVVELLETIEPDADVVSACRDLKAQGYTLALDDFVYDPRFEPLMALADIIKVDFLLSDREQRQAIARRSRARGIRLLAEKVETEEEFRWAVEHGYQYFQGYFFARPTVMQGREIPAWKVQALQLLKEVQKEEIDYSRLLESIRLDVSLSYKLLRYINSPHFAVRTQVTSIKQALAMLGEANIRKWVSVAALATMAQDRPSELVRLSLVRAFFCESLASLLPGAPKASSLFMAGLFSLLESVLQRPLAEILAEIAMPADVKAAFNGEPGPLALALDLSTAWERADWSVVAEIVAGAGLDGDAIGKSYLSTIEKVRELIEE